MKRTTIAMVALGLLAGCDSTPDSGGPKKPPSKMDASAPAPANDLSTTPGPTADLAVPGSTDLSNSGSPADMAMGGGGTIDLASTAPYPGGPYGKNKGDIIDPSIAFECFGPGSDTSQKMTTKDLFDVDGKKGFNALILDTSELTCVPCQDESKEMKAQADAKNWKGLGIVPVVLLDGSVEQAKKWRDRYQLTFGFVCYEPTEPLRRTGTPTNHVVDPRTMKIIDLLDGYGDENDPDAKAYYNSIYDLANKNKK